MSANRILECFLNVDSRQWSASDGTYLLPRSIPSVAQETILCRLHLVHNDGTPFTELDDTATFNFYILNGTTVVAIASTVNVATDWEGEDGLDVKEGRVCFVMNTNTEEMATILVGFESKSLRLVMSSKVGSTYINNFNVPITCVNAHVPDTTPTPLVSIISGNVAVVSGTDQVVVTTTVPAGTIPLCSLNAPIGDTNNIYVTNTQVAVDNLSFTVFLSSSVPTSGFQVSYIIIP